MKQHSEVLRSVLITGLLVVLLALAAVFGSFQRNTQLQSRVWVIHTYQVLQQLEEVSSALSDAEAAQSNYLLTGHPRYLEQYKQASLKAETAANKVRQQTADNPDQQRNNGILASKVEEKRAIMDQLIQAVQPKNPAQLASSDIEARKLHYSQDIEKILQDMKRGEHELLEKRARDLAENTQNGNLLLLIFLALAVAAVLVLGWFMRRYLLGRIALERMLASRAHQIQLVLDTMSDGVILADMQGQFVLFNPAAQHLVGPLYSMPPDKWSHHFGIFGSDQTTHYPSEQLPLARALRGEAVDDVELYLKSPSVPMGRWINATARPIKQQDDDFEGAIVVFRDISERKEAEKRVSEFYSTVSHELRTPLTSIRGSLGLIEGGVAGDVSETASQLVRIARTESDRLIRLINDILDIRKLEAGKLDLRKSTVQSQDLVERCIQGCQGFAEERGITLLTSIKTTGPLECDEDRVIQVLTNFVSNAIKFSRPGQRVTVALQPGTAAFKYSVTDEGEGIPQEQMHKLFGKFQQIDQTDARRQEGTGLGLAISKAIVEEHGGVVGVESELGLGSTFWFELPAVFSPARIDEDDAEIITECPALVVEDDPKLSHLLKSHLAQDGFDVLCAATISEATNILKKVVPLVVLLDLHLPDGSGLDLLATLDKLGGEAEIPVIVITGSSQSEHYGNPTLVDWITKPFDPQRLNRALDKVREGFGPAQVLIVEDDAATRSVLKQQLKTLGIACREAEDGMRAIAEMKENDPDLLILDLEIPAPNGGELIDIMKSEGNGAKPLIVYTASDLTEEQKQRLSLGLTAHLTKSRTSEEQLLNTVRSFVSRLLLEKVRNSHKGAIDG